ncbi:MAG: hypothetical protein AB1898_02570 [Acidobacteriota bacterium]
MAGVYYQLVSCRLCEGEMYGPVGLRVEGTQSHEERISEIEKEMEHTHPHHTLEGQRLKRYSDFQFPSY